MKLNSLNLNIANNRGNQFQQPGSLAPVGQTGQSQSRPGDRTGLSREAQQAAGAQGMRGGSAQQLTQTLSRDIGQVLQAQGSGDQNRSQQALQQLGQTYQQGQQSGQLQQVPPMVRQTAESLLGINQQGQGQAQQAGKGGGCSGGGEAGGGGQAGGPSESSGGGSAGEAGLEAGAREQAVTAENNLGGAMLQGMGWRGGGLGRDEGGTTEAPRGRGARHFGQ